ncbi:MAG TPA: diguanylate cyclase [Polyangiaceae bacterium]
MEPLSIVVVDDDPDAAEALCRLLGSLGSSCRVAHGGEEAVALLSRAQFDLVISDSRMPGVDGLSLCRAIRTRDDPYVYFILVTADDDRAHLLEAMRSGADDYLTKPIDPETLCARLLCAERVIRLHRTLRARNRQLRHDSERNFQVARVDALTGARNRRALAEDVQAKRAGVIRYGSPCAVAMCDLDHFKEYNDALGHLAGDEALKRVVRVTQAQLRAGDALYRFGGEEFVVLLQHQNLLSARAAMERVRRAVAHSAPSDAEKITISVGLAELRADDADDEVALGRADSALYRAKLGGRNRIET